MLTFEPSVYVINIYLALRIKVHSEVLANEGNVAHKVSLELLADELGLQAVGNHWDGDAVHNALLRIRLLECFAHWKHIATHQSGYAVLVIILGVEDGEDCNAGLQSSLDFVKLALGQQGLRCLEGRKIQLT